MMGGNHLLEDLPFIDCAGGNRSCGDDLTLRIDCAVGLVAELRFTGAVSGD